MKHIRIKREWLEIMKELNGEEFKETVLAIADYEGGTARECHLQGSGRIVWSVILNSLERDKVNAKNGEKGGNPRLLRKTADRKNLPRDECGTSVTDLFEEFWAIYPRKVGKKLAKQIFQGIKPSRDLLEEMKRAVLEQRESEQWTRDRGRFIPHPSTWLKQGRWMDEGAPTQEANKIFNNFDIGVHI